jgi:hypothetical protein
MKYLEGGYTSRIALSLTEDIYGANGDLDEFQVQDRLMKAIIEWCEYHLDGQSGLWGEDFIPMSVEEHAYKPALTLSQAASLVLGVWRHMHSSALAEVCRFEEFVDELLRAERAARAKGRKSPTPPPSRASMPR